MTHNGRNELLGSATYNSRHQALTITDASGQTHTLAYNPRGQVLSVTDPNGQSTTFSYDTNGYLLAITGPLQTSNALITLAYDGFGRVRTVTDSEGYAATTVYDAFDRPIQTSYPDGTFKQYVYDRLDLVAARDRLGRWATNTYDAMEQPLSVTDPQGNTTRFEWCQCGSLTAMLDPLGRRTSWTYDVQGRPTAKHYADGSMETYAYEDSTSRLRLRQDPGGQQTVFEYYADNTPKRVRYPNAAIPTPTVTFTYDPDYNRVATMQDGMGTTTYAYNPITPMPTLGAGSLQSVSGPLPNSTVTYQYDSLGRVLSRSLNGAALAMTYDALGRITGLTNLLGAFQFNYIEASERLASEAYPNGQTNLYAYYDNLGDHRLMEILNLKPDGSLLSAFGYGYNSVGQITSWTNQSGSSAARTWQLAYDAGGQLTGAVLSEGAGPVGSLTYAYDAGGNRLLSSSNDVPQAAGYNALNQLVSADTGPADSLTCEWDAAQRLTAVNQGAHRSEFYYDGLDRRVRIVEKVNGVVVADNYFIWSGEALCEARDGSATRVVRRFFPEGEGIIGSGGSTNLFYTRDHLGSIREGLDSAGSLVARYDYDPFGQQTVLDETLVPSFAFTGHFQHKPTGLYLARYRVLDPRAGRWLNRDPLAEAAGFNLYAYAGNDPVRFADPSGLFIIGIEGAAEAETGLGVLGPSGLPVGPLGAAVQVSGGVGIATGNSFGEVLTASIMAASIRYRQPHGLIISGVIIAADRLLSWAWGSEPLFKFGGFVSYGVGVPFLPPCFAPTPYGTGYIQKGSTVSGALVLGRSYGYGYGPFISSATDFSQLKGPFVTGNFNSPGGSGSFGVDPTDPSTWILSISPGENGYTSGTSASLYTTQTPFAGNF